MLKRVLVLLTVGLAVLTLISPLASQTPPKVSIIPGIISGLFPLYIIANVILMGIWIFMRKAWFLVPIIVLFVGKKAVDQHFGMHFEKEEETSKSIVVGTFNVFGLSKIKLQKSLDLDAQLENELHASALDVICIQENNPYSSGKIDEVEKGRYPYKYGHAGVKLLSRFPIEGRGNFDFDSPINGCLWSDIKVGKNALRVYCAHFRSNAVSAKADELIQDGSITERKTWLGIREILSRYKSAAQIRANQAQKIKEHMVASKYPVLLMGDLNDHPLSYTVKLLGQGMKDSFVEKGRGWGTTYGGNLPLLRIDYIFADEGLEILNHSVKSSHISDHYFVSSVIQWPD